MRQEAILLSIYLAWHEEPVQVTRNTLLAVQTNWSTCWKLLLDWSIYLTDLRVIGRSKIKERLIHAITYSISLDYSLIIKCLFISNKSDLQFNTWDKKPYYYLFTLHGMRNLFRWQETHYWLIIFICEAW
jgi:hypothetical protein